MSEDVLVLIEELKKRIEALETFKVEQEWLTKDIAEGQGRDRQTIAELKRYINPEGRTRNDFDILANELTKEVLNRKKGLDYKTVMNIFRFGSAPEAYRLMEKAVKKFPRDVRIKTIKSGNRKKRLIARVGAPT